MAVRDPSTVADGRLWPSFSVRFGYLSKACRGLTANRHFEALFPRVWNWRRSRARSPGRAARRKSRSTISNNRPHYEAKTGLCREIVGGCCLRRVIFHWFINGVTEKSSACANSRSAPFFLDPGFSSDSVVAGAKRNRSENRVEPAASLSGGACEWSGADDDARRQMRSITKDCLKTFVSLARKEAERSRTVSAETGKGGAGLPVADLPNENDERRRGRLRPGAAPRTPDRAPK
jgi:hypothetical protein